jgi:WbqC-like protein family
MNCDSNNNSEFNTNLIKCLRDYLKIECQILLSSELEKDNLLKGSDQVIQINRILGSSHYVNLMGGANLYKESQFTECGLELSFIQSVDNVCSHFSEPFCCYLSIIDTLMLYPLDEIRSLIKNYCLIKQDSVL